VTAPDKTEATLRALAREVDRLTRLVDDVDSVKESAASAHRAILNLSQAVNVLTEQVEALGQGGQPEEKRKAPPRRYWLTIDDPDTAAVELEILAEWVAGVYLRFPEVTLSDCWVWHETVIAELYALRQAWLEALDGDIGSAARIVDWHERHRPGVAERVQRELTGCGLKEHGPNGTRAYRPPRVPGTGLAGQVARWWAETHGESSAPPPSREMVEQERERFKFSQQSKY
jgi:hypothetical protein